MIFPQVNKLGQQLVQLTLVEPAHIEECYAELDSSRLKEKEFLGFLESRNYLTSYQVRQIKRGETDSLVIGNYKLLYKNASGSFARVFRACLKETDQMVGLKLLRERWAVDPVSVKMFHREAELCRKLKHKNIVPIYEVGQDRNYHFFTMEFVIGGNLRDFIKIRKKLSPIEATRCILDLAEGLEYALRNGITHRDLKMTNVLMSSTGVAKLVDFGLAGDDSSGDAQQALEYATLEKSTGAPQNDPRSDLFFLGTIFYELLIGTPPYARTKSRDERKEIRRYSEIRQIGEVDPLLPNHVIDIVDRLLQINPTYRYQSATELIPELRASIKSLREASEDDLTVNGVDSSTQIKSLESNGPTVMCVENRPHQQNLLREYLSKHGYRVLMLSNIDRALDRIKNNPPDCIILMGGAIGDDLGSFYKQAVKNGNESSMISIAVLDKKQLFLKDDMNENSTSRVLVQPQLRDLRNEIDKTLEHIKKAAQ